MYLNPIFVNCDDFLDGRRVAGKKEKSGKKECNWDVNNRIEATDTKSGYTKMKISRVGQIKYSGDSNIGQLQYSNLERFKIIIS